jgi:3-hydroxyisobutyrate dehydrogenase-like beta-hydroxyacid dehydrogenase
MALTVGVIGLGNMGEILARRVAEKYKVLGYDVDPKKRALLSNENISCKDTLKELAENVDVIILSLPNSEISLSVVQDIAQFLRPGSTIIETSTVLPEDVTRLAKVCSSYTINVVDSAILGGVSHVQSGNFSFLVGGSEINIQGVQEVLEATANDVKILGPLGSGMAAKIINNAVAHSVMVLIVEAGALGISLGISSKAIYELLSGETALQRPLTHRFGERILNGDYEGGMSVANARKDSTLALQLAQKLGVPLFAISATDTVYEIANKEGLENLDYASIARLWERWMNTSFVQEVHTSTF